MIEKVSLNSNRKQHTPNRNGQGQKNTAPTFQGLGDIIIRGVQACEKEPMVNVTALDLSTAIIPRTYFETCIGSKRKDENGKETNGRKLNIMGGFEAFRRESSGLLINCIIPSFVVMGAAKLFNRPVMGEFNKSNLTKCWANGDAINSIEKYYNNAKGSTKEDKIFNTLKNMFDDIEGVNGDISKNGLKQFKTIFKDDKEYIETLRKMAKNIVADKTDKKITKKAFETLVSKTGISENIRFVGDKGFSTNNLESLCHSTTDILHGVVKENIDNTDKISKYFKKAKNLVNIKSIAGLGIIIPLAIAAQPINRWITHKMSGKKGAPLYNDGKERVLMPEEKKKLTAQKFFAVPLMAGVAGLSMILDRPSLKMFQFKNIFPTMDQARIISAATFSSRIAASEDSNELKENTIRDIATFSSFYFLGDYAEKGIATLIEKNNKNVKLINKLKAPKESDSFLTKMWNWAKHTTLKSTDELKTIKDEALRNQSKKLRTICQLGSIAFSLISLGVFIPLYTRTQTNKKELARRKALDAQLAASMDLATQTTTKATSSCNTTGKTSSSKESTTNFMNEDKPTFEAFFNSQRKK